MSLSYVLLQILLKGRLFLSFMTITVFSTKLDTNRFHTYLKSVDADYNIAGKVPETASIETYSCFKTIHVVQAITAAHGEPDIFMFMGTGPFYVHTNRRNNDAFNLSVHLGSQTSRLSDTHPHIIVCERPQFEPNELKTAARQIQTYNGQKENWLFLYCLPDKNSFSSSHL